MTLQAAGAKPCRVCGGTFEPFNSTQIVCGIRCARRVPVLARKAEKEDRKATRARLDALRPLSYWMKQAQVAFNAWVRQRDAHLPCISCSRHHVGSWDAGHYLTVGARPELRFDEANVHRQCVPCNQHLHGNLVLFRLGLIARLGQAAVDRLEGPHVPKQYRADDLKAIRDDYRARARALQC
jgi:hypothetical protein